MTGQKSTATIDFKNIHYWIFDLDGTLTVAAHDFDKIRSTLGLPRNKPILEVLETYPEEEAQKIMGNLEKIEMEIARQARPQKDVYSLLKTLSEKQVTLGILTRNNHKNTKITLQKSGILDFFPTEHILDRNSCRHKPDPDGVLKLLQLWHAQPKKTVIVGDYKFDLIAGRKAGVHTIYLDIPGDRTWEEYADLTVGSFAELLELLS